ncbi:MAG: hypothetical protein WA876_06630 [Candidatus Acidiferrales bacterium]
MRRSLIYSLMFAFVITLPLLPGVTSQQAKADGTVIKGWVSDKGCAAGRANGGTFTGTNPDCAKKCIASGAKMVLIVPDQRTLLTIDNPSAAKSNIGDYVEVIGNVEPKTKTLHIKALKMITKGKAMCDLPAPTK